MVQFGKEKTMVLEISKKLERVDKETHLKRALVRTYSEIQEKTISELKNEKEKVLETNQRLKEVNEKLNSSNESISFMNENLEEKIAARTQGIVELNKKITEYARYTSHDIRAPLARILGLVNLMSMEFRESNGGLAREQQKFYIETLSASAAELDSKIKAVASLLNEVPMDYS